MPQYAPDPGPARFPPKVIRRMVVEGHPTGPMTSTGPAELPGHPRRLFAGRGLFSPALRGRSTAVPYRRADALRRNRGDRQGLCLVFADGRCPGSLLAADEAGRLDESSKGPDPAAHGPRASGSAPLPLRPDAGSRPGRDAPARPKVDGGWKLNGAKNWITNSGVADVYVTFAR